MRPEGYLYEDNTVSFLKKKGIVDPLFQPAGADYSRPDIEFMCDGKSYGVELKKRITTAGQVALNYSNAKNTFEFSQNNPTDEKLYLIDLATQSNVLNLIRSKWRKPLWACIDRDYKWKKRWEEAGEPDLEERHRQDIENCPEFYIPVSSNSISGYYKTKDTHYFQLGTHGFYRLGRNDPAGLNIGQNPPIPLWENSHECRIRVRIKTNDIKGAALREKLRDNPTMSPGYTPSIELTMRRITKSLYNIAPCVATSATILESQAVFPKKMILDNDQEEEKNEND